LANEITSLESKLPALPGPKGIERDRRAFKDLICRFREARSNNYWSLQVIEAFIVEAEAMRPTFEALLKPATVPQLKNHLAALVGAFPAAGNADLDIYGRILSESVGAQQPTIGALEAACRHLWCTVKFRPAICEVLEALNEAEQKLRKDWHYLTEGIYNERRWALQHIEQERMIQERDRRNREPWAIMDDPPQIESRRTEAELDAEPF
jgi:hypothetical protein